MEDYPGNSYKERGILKNFPMPDKDLFANDNGYYYVRIKYTVWPSIYGDQWPIHFPTLISALTFAENNLSETKPVIRVYAPDGVLADIFTAPRF
jgi:hypothetical protein